MAHIMEDIAYLSQEIGPRPAGTEEEQQAALYIADEIQKRTGFTANIEDFNTATQPGLIEAICFGAAAIFSLLAIIANIFVIPAFFISLAAAILYVLELLDRPVLSRFFERGVSQNVVSRYTPGAGPAERGRKVVLVAHYDSSKVQAELNGGLFKSYPTLLKASAVGLVALPVIWLIRTLFLLHATGGAVIFFNVLAFVALILALIPVVVFIMHKTATYNEAANNNAAGVATMMEVARIIADGSLSEEEIAAMADAVIQGAQRAFEEGVVPEGATLEYDEGLDLSDEERLASAKSAIAAITGRPVRSYEVEKIDFTPMADRDDIELYNEDMDYGEYAYSEDDELTTRLPEVDADQAQDAQAAPLEDAGMAAAEGQAVKETDEKAAPLESVFLPLMPVEGALEAAAAEEVAAAEAAEVVTEIAAEAAIEEAAEEAVVEEAAQAAPYTPCFTPVATPAPELAPTNEPAWFTAGRAKAAKKPEADATPVRRSRYADALDAALAASNSHMNEAARMLDEGTIERISKMQRDIEAGASAKAFSAEPLQNLLSDEAKAEAEEAEEAQAEAFDATFEDSLETTAAEATSEEAAEASEEAVEASEASEAPEADETSETPASPAETTTATVDLNAPAEEIEAAEEAAAPDHTIAMAPIDISKLETEPAPKTDAPTGESHDFSKIEAPQRRYRSISLPAFEQLEEEDNDAPSRYNSLDSERIPRITADTSAEPVSLIQDFNESPQATPSTQPEETMTAEEKRAALRNAIPSLSGEFAPVVIDEAKPADEENAEVSKTGSFATASASNEVPFAPVGDELVASLEPEERYVEDADDSSFDETTTETGAYAGPGYVEMPESRLSRFFNRFRKKEKVEETSTSEWLDVDENFDARTVGAERGSWESFRTDADDAADTAKEAADTTDAPSTAETTSRTKEAAEAPETSDRATTRDRFARMQSASAASAFAPAAAPAVDDEYASDFDDENDEEAPAQGRLFGEYEYVDVDEEDSRSWNGGAFSQLRARLAKEEAVEEEAAELAEEAGADLDLATIEVEDAEVQARETTAVPLVDTTEEARIADETSMVYHFRNPDINTEVWFVALGGEYAGNSGMKAFLAQHSADLRGAVIINLEATGAGEFSFIAEEGRIMTQRPSSRMKRILQKASEITGLATPSASITWRESAASFAMKRGLQAMTLAGMEGGKPALMGQGDDVLENVDEASVAEKAQFIVELIKNI